MRKIFAFLPLIALTGCLSPIKPPEVSEWTLHPETLADRVNTAKYGVTRLSSVQVRSPYDVRSFAVLRADSSFAFDPYNHFAAIPSQLLKGVAQDELAASGRFEAVVASTSVASASHVLELTVTDLRLDCSAATEENPSQIATVALSALVLDRDRKIVASGSGSGNSSVEDGDFGTAFSKAFAAAVDKVVGTL